jgi:hypothetical protein
VTSNDRPVTEEAPVARSRRHLVLTLGLLAVAVSASAATPTAVYRVTFTATWTAETHPQDYPPAPHFSGFVGGTHDATVSFWAEGQPASLGIKRMAEWGSQADFAAEVETAIAGGSADSVITAPVLWDVPGSLSLTFTATVDHPRVTLVSMVAPSPDWFVGVAGLNLLGNGDWAAEQVVDLYPWDAGTDSGATYTSSDQPTVPPTAIFAITGDPFTPGVPLGTLTFTRIDVVSAVPPAAEMALQAWPNPFNPRTTIAWDLPVAGPVRVAVHDPRGRLVAVLLDAVQPAGPGSVIWNGRGDEGRIMPAGIYAVRVESSAGQAGIKLTLLK